MIEEQIQFMARHRLLQDEVERLRVLSEGKDVCKNQQTDASCDSAATGDADDVQTDVARSQPRSIIADADAEILYSRIVEVMEKGEMSTSLNSRLSGFLRLQSRGPGLCRRLSI